MVHSKFNDYLFINLVMDSNRSKIVFNGILDIYLVVSSFIVSFWLVIAEFELFRFILLILILSGNCYWMFKLQSFSRLRDFYAFLKIPTAYELPQKIYDNKIPTNNPNYRSRIFDNSIKPQGRLSIDPIANFREPFRSSYQGQQKVQQKDSGLPITSLKQLGFGESKQNSFFDNKGRNTSRISNYSNKRKSQKGQMSYEYSQMEQIQTNTLNDKCEQTLQTQRIKKQTYWNGLQRVKSMMSYRIQTLINKHAKNMTELNNIMIDNFDMPITDFSPNNFRKEGKIFLDEIIQAINYDPSLKNWKWSTSYYRSISKNDVLSRIKQLVEEREFIDKHLLINKSFDKCGNRQQSLMHLDRLSRDPSKTEHSFSSIRNQKSSREDQLALFRFFQANVNLTLPPQCQHLKIRSYNSKRQPETKGLQFSLTQLQSEVIHINFVSGKVTFNCEPGPNNIYSAIYFYLREITMKYSKDIKYSNSLRDMVTQVIN